MDNNFENRLSAIEYILTKYIENDEYIEELKNKFANTSIKDIVINIIPNRDIVFKTRSLLSDILKRLELTQQDRLDLQRYIEFGGGDNIELIKYNLDIFIKYKDKILNIIKNAPEEFDTLIEIFNYIEQHIQDTPFEKGEAENSAVLKGGNNIAGILATALGQHTTASGDLSFAEGFQTTAHGDCSHAEGRSTYKAPDIEDGDIVDEFAGLINKWDKNKFSLVYGDSAHSEGTNTLALGDSSHAEGITTKAIAPGSHSEGLGTKASVNGCHAEGVNTQANAFASHAEGAGAIANGTISHAEGINTETSNQAEHAEGTFNKSNVGTIHSVGIGTPDKRKNAHEIMHDGKHYIYGIGGYDGTNPTESNDLARIITQLQEILKYNNLTINVGNIYAFINSVNDKSIEEASIYPLIITYGDETEDTINLYDYINIIHKFKNVRIKYNLNESYFGYLTMVASEKNNNDYIQSFGIQNYDLESQPLLKISIIDSWINVEIAQI